MTGYMLPASAAEMESGMDYLNAFWIGGLICALVQILMEKTKLMPGRIMVLLVCTGAVLGALGIYEPFLKFAGPAPACRFSASAIRCFRGSGKRWMKWAFSACLPEVLRQAPLAAPRPSFSATSPH